MKQIEIVITGATGLSGSFLLQHLAKVNPGVEIYCLVRPSSDRTSLDNLNVNLNYLTGDSNTSQTWDEILATYTPKTIIHIASIRHLPVILPSLKKAAQTPRLIVIGTTGVYSQYNQYGGIYQEIEAQLGEYPGSYCLLRPTMIYGSHRDKNLHKLIRFCHRYGFFPVFGPGSCLLQPIHGEDLALAILATLQRPKIEGSYDLSGGSVVTFRQLLALVAKLIDKPIRQISLPLNLGVWLGTIGETFLGERSPLRREQVLRLQEDKAYAHDAAQKDLDFRPRSLELGLQQEVELLRSQGII